jgi:DNA segregation ATPase FtsK/SpoIIIE-like protein
MDYKINYEPIPFYDNITWNLTSEACHILLLAVSGAGKSMLLAYLSGMVLKQGHHCYMVDAKSSPMGATFESAGIRVAKNPDEIIELLTELVDKMEETYRRYFDTAEISLSSNFAKLDLPAHVLIFDEVLTVLESGDKKQNVEMVRLLKQLALKGRMAGFVLVVTAQKLLATDLPKAITEQCQTRLLLGAIASDELFHLVTGSYKKDLGTAYKGGVGTGYALTPKTGLTYFETPLMDVDDFDFQGLLLRLKGKHDE